MVKSAAVTRLDRQIALVLAAGVIGLLVRATPLDLLPGDAGEFQFAAWNFGLAHATGYPLYLLAGGVWQHLWALVGVAPAASLNILSAVFAGVAAAFFYLLLLRWMPGEGVVPRLAALLATAFFVANPTLRSQALQAEVYTLHAMLLIAILWAAQDVTAAEAAPAAARPWARRFATLAFLFSLGLTHHATTLLLAPALLVYLTVWQRNWWRNGRAWLWALLAGVLPLLLYLYVPLRSGADASPWYHQRLGNETLTLYENTWPAFLNFITGRSISVGFNDLQAALAGAPNALVLWLRHFEWGGLVLMVVGIYVLIRLRNWPVLALTVTYFAIQQIFNLFYAIGDIFVYYIPLYLVACIWIAFAGAGIGSGFQLADSPAPADVASPPTTQPSRSRWGAPLLALLFVLPVQLWIAYAPLFEQLKLESAATRQQWEAILAAAPSGDAILISNDRNEIAPLFYLQAVEKRGAGLTGIFPLIAPQPRFADVGATIQTALDAGSAPPVFLIKPMPGLESRFLLDARQPPLVAVMGEAATSPSVAVDAAYGPLTLLGYTWAPVDAGVEVALTWRVNAPLPKDYTTTVQIFDGANAKIGQDDRLAGGVYYPPSLWKPGETLVDRHMITLPLEATPVWMLVGMYAGPEAKVLAAPLEIPLNQD
ncbi:MAG: DUF2723 domain-containing protein [Caldilineaceae bacterium]|nr:DUF2723 domain-containing protein [Caldilineaceae bacterium]